MRKLSLSLLLLCAALPANAGDRATHLLRGNVVEVRRTYDAISLSLEKVELKVLVLNAANAQQRVSVVCDAGVQGDCNNLALLGACSSEGFGGDITGDNPKTYDGGRCLSGYGLCRELTGWIEVTTSGLVLHAWQLTTASACSAK